MNQILLFGGGIFYLFVRVLVSFPPGPPGPGEQPHEFQPWGLWSFVFVTTLVLLARAIITTVAVAARRAGSCDNRMTVSSEEREIIAELRSNQKD
jgi:heme/copper-type cytochrome/quinol oxidase subunit 3